MKLRRGALGSSGLARRRGNWLAAAENISAKTGARHSGAAARGGGLASGSYLAATISVCYFVEGLSVEGVLPDASRGVRRASDKMARELF